MKAATERCSLKYLFFKTREQDTLNKDTNILE